MKRLAAAMAAFVVVVGLSGCVGSGTAGWVALIDGNKGLENFDRLGDANWHAENGAVVADRAKDNSYLVTKKSYKDFQIRAEFWADHNTNSGIFIRAQDPTKIGADNAYEVNIYDQRPGPEYGTGAIVNFAKIDKMQKAGGRWNTFLITARGDTITVELNGVQTVRLNGAKFANGPFALQFGNHGKLPGGAIKWRKVEVWEL
jgi:hypothetical protein